MIDYYAVQSDIKTILSGGTYTDTVKEYFIEAMERDMMLGNMPFINVRMDSANLEVRSLPNGYMGYILFKIDVVCFDLTEYKKASIVRDRLLKEVQLRLQSNRQFSAGVETSQVGPRVEFSAGIAEENDLVRGHVAAAAFDFVVTVFIEPA